MIHRASPQGGLTVGHLVSGRVGDVRPLPKRGIGVRETSETTIKNREFKLVDWKWEEQSYKHPFKLMPYWDNTTAKLRVSYGVVTCRQFYEYYETGSQLRYESREYLPSINSGSLVGYGVDISSAGSLTLATGTHGIWCVGDGQTLEAQYMDDPEEFVSEYGYWASWQAGDFKILSSTTYIEYDDAGDATLRGNAFGEKPVWFLGQVIVPSSGRFTVKQFRRSDIDLTLSGFFVRQLVSTAPGNSITSNSDGVFYDEPDQTNLRATE